MKIIKILIFIFLFGCLGYFREYFFVNLNNIMYQKYYGHTDLPMSSLLSFFKLFSYNTLYFSKYFLTLLWIGLFYVVNLFCLKKMSEQKILLKILTYTYILLLILAAVSMMYGYFINKRFQDDEYTISRWLLGIAQSPIICLILMASEKLNTKPNKP